MENARQPIIILHFTLKTLHVTSLSENAYIILFYKFNTKSSYLCTLAVLLQNIFKREDLNGVVEAYNNDFRRIIFRTRTRCCIIQNEK